MVENQALAIKYRPKNFSALIGQEPVRQTLVHALDKQRLCHAYLFSGLRGSGKTSTARIFAKALLCDEGPSSEPCGVCENCRMAADSRHIDIIELDAASNRKIDDVRDLIEHTKYKPSIGRYKVFIIDEVHMLTKEAFNALLKTLEEPPDFVKFILATTDPLKVPTTILSRTQHFRFKKIKRTDVVHHLEHILAQEGVGYEQAALDLLARSGGGSLRDTLTLLDQAILFAKGFVSTERVVEMLDIVNPETIEELLNLVLEGERGAVIELLSTIEDGDPETLLDETLSYLKEHLFERDPKFHATTIQRFLTILSEAKHLLSLNADGGFILALTFLKMTEATKLERLDEAIAQLQNNHATPSVAATPAVSTPRPASVQPETPANTFSLLQKRVMERDEKLGECFASFVAFVSYEGDTLTWESRADGECREQLRQHYGIILQMVREIYGPMTSIAVRRPDPSSEPSTPAAAKEGAIIPVAEEGIAASGSCLIQEEESTPIRSQEPKAILEDPFVQKAVELFEPTKIKITVRV